MRVLENFFLKNYDSVNFTIQKKARALLYYNFLMMIILPIIPIAYAFINPQGFVKGLAGASSIIFLVVLSLFFIYKGSLDIAVMVYVIPTIVIVILARFVKAIDIPYTGFTAYLYYNFYIIVFVAVFGKKMWVPITTSIFIIANIVFYILVKGKLDPVSLDIASTGITNSTPALFVTGVVSYINIRLTSFSNQMHKEEADSSSKQYSVIANILQRIKEISTNLQSSADTFRDTSQTMSHSTHDQAALVEESSASMEEIASTIDRVAVNSGKQTDSISSIEDSIDQLNTHISDVSTRSQEVKDESENAIIQGDKAVEISSKTLQSMININDSAEKINNIVKIITEITDQTNLLSLNASIESARAGDAGKGFAVVADEISKLAESSSSSTKEIIQLISETTSSITEGTQMINILDNHIKDIMSTLKKSNILSNEMSDATDKQLQLSNLVKDTIHNINELSGGISIAMNEIATNAIELSKSNDTINEITQKTSVRSDELLRTTDNLMENIQSLLEIVNDSH